MTTTDEVREAYAMTGEGLDGDLAIRHLKVVLGTFATKHEHKVAGAAYLMSLWFPKIERKS